MLPGIQLKHKIGWETVNITLDLFVQSPGGDIVKLGQISIQHNLLATNQKNAGYHML